MLVGTYNIAAFGRRSITIDHILLSAVFVTGRI